MGKIEYLTRPIIIGGITLSFWLIVSFVTLYFHVPYSIYVDNVRSPWEPITAPTYPETGVKDIEFANSTHGWIGGENGLIMATTDGWSSWFSQNSGINTTIITIDFFDPQVGIAIDGQYGGILITQNGGNNWTILERPKYPHPEYGWSNASLWDAKMCNSEAAWLLGNYGSFFYVNISSSNVTFVSYLELPLHDLAMVNFTHGWAVGSYGNIVRTKDGWQTFEDQSLGTSKSFFGVFLWNHNKGWVVGEDHTILVTSNGGKRWRVQYSYPFPMWSSNILTDIVFITEDKGWTVGGGIRATDNGGKCWMNHGSKTWGPSKIAFANEVPFGRIYDILNSPVLFFSSRILIEIKSKSPFLFKIGVKSLFFSSKNIVKYIHLIFRSKQFYMQLYPLNQNI